MVYCVVSFVADPTEKLHGKCLYFIRNTEKPVKTNVASDETLLFGEATEDILQVFEGTISNVNRVQLSSLCYVDLMRCDAMRFDSI